MTYGRFMLTAVLQMRMISRDLASYSEVKVVALEVPRGGRMGRAQASLVLA